MGIDDQDMATAMSVWDSLPSDVQLRDVGELVRASPTLGTLNRAGIDIMSVCRYGDRPTHVAELIGATAGEYPHYVKLLLPPTPGRTFPGGSAPTPDHFRIKAEACDIMHRLLKGLEQQGVISRFRVQAQLSGQGGKISWADKDKVSPGTKVTGWRVHRGEVVPDLQGFLSGPWLTAFAYAVTHDQFTRAGRPFRDHVQRRVPPPARHGSRDQRH
ncbi:MAG: hypothetical protein ACXVYW_14950 [Oryzihumus sp.]